MLSSQFIIGESDELSQREKKNQQMACAPSELRSAWASAESDQSSLCAQWVAKEPNFLHAESKDSDFGGCPS